MTTRLAVFAGQSKPGVLRSVWPESEKQDKNPKIEIISDGSTALIKDILESI
jgi:hypothetical protein